MPLIIEQERAPPPHSHVTLVRLEGALTRDTRLAIMETLRTGRECNFLIDMRSVSKIDEPGALGLITSVIEGCDEKMVKLIGCQSAVMDELRRFRLSSVFEFHQDESAALARFTPGKRRQQLWTYHYSGPGY